MPTVQSTYSETFRKGFPGMVANSEVENSISRVLQTGNLIFGVPVIKGNLDNNCVIAVTTGLFLGISIRDVTLLHATPDRYEAPDNVGILNEGVIWVTAGGNVGPAVAPTWDPADPAAGWKPSAVGFLPIVDAKFLDTGVDGDMVRLHLARSSFGRVLTAA